MNRAVMCTRPSVWALVLAAGLLRTQSAQSAVEVTGAGKQRLASCAGDLAKNAPGLTRIEVIHVEAIQRGNVRP